MSFLDRFQGNAAADFVQGPPTAARTPQPASLQLLFPQAPAWDAAALQQLLRNYHPEFAAASVELHAVAEVPGAEAVLSEAGPAASHLGLIGWGRHVVRVAVVPSAMPAAAIDACLQTALLPPEVKADARAHAAHVLLYDASHLTEALSIRMGLAAVAGVMAEFGAIVTLNEEARTAILSTDLLPDEPGEDMLATLKALPLPYFYAGFAKLNVTETPGVWMRTWAGYRMGVPDLAYHAAGHEEGQATFKLFPAIMGYLQDTKLQFEEGEALRVDEDTLFALRKPTAAEWWLDSPGEIWVLHPATLK
jgi:hypothetical protein